MQQLNNLFASTFFQVIALALIAIFSGFYFFPIYPTPSDDLFYLDAAYRLAHWNYPKVDVNFPYHHYLRWPVILPLALIIYCFEYTEITLSVYFWSIIFIISILSWLVLGKLNLAAKSKFLGALSVYLLIPSLIPLALRAEPSMIILLLLSLLMLLRVSEKTSRDSQWLSSTLSGVCFALAVLAQQSCIFSIIAFAVFGAYINGFSKKLLGLALFAALGGSLVFLLSVLLDYFLFGDPLTTYKVIKHWHFGATEQLTLSQFLNANNSKKFVLGFIKNLISTNWVLSLFCLNSVILLIVSCFVKDRARIGLGLLAITAILATELFGPFVIDKIYLRLASAPIFFMCLSAATFNYTPQAKSLFIKSLQGSIPAAVLLFLIINQSLNKIPEDAWTVYYRNPIQKVMELENQKQGPKKGATLIFDHSGVPGLIPWAWAVRAYSYYQIEFKEVSSLTSCKKNKAKHRGKFNYYVTKELLGVHSNCELIQKFGGQTGKLYLYKALHQSLLN